MRMKDLGIIFDIGEKFNEEESLEIFRRMCRVKFFEENARKAYDAGLIKCPIYLSCGRESISAALSLVYENPFIFAQHRAHDLYLSYGGDVIALIDELLGRPTGCAKGMGGSASIHSPAIGMFGHSGLMGDQIPIAVGFALGKNKNVLAVMGDASAEEDYVLGALGYASHKKLPILFVCADNNLSILTKTETRRNWAMKDVAESFGLKAIEITDDPWLIMHHTRILKNALPAFMNIRTARAVWHAGSGSDGEPEWDRFELVKDELRRFGLNTEAEKIENDMKLSIETLWGKQIDSK